MEKRIKVLGRGSLSGNEHYFISPRKVPITALTFIS